MAGENKTIAIVATNLLNGFSAQIIWAIQTESLNTDYDLVIYTTKSAINMGGAEFLYEKIANDKRAGAVIVIAYPISDKAIDGFYNSGITPVVIETRKKGVNCVRANNEKGAYDAGVYLAGKKRKKIGIIVGDPAFADSQKERLAGFQAGLKDNGININENMIYTISRYSYQAGKDAFKNMIMNEVDSVFCAAGDYVAQGFLHEANKQGVSFPYSMSLIGFDDVEVSEDLGLSTVRQPLSEMGKEAFKMAVDSLKKTGVPVREKVFECSLIIRETA